MNRDLKFDGIKFIMIFLVVFGHIVSNDGEWDIKTIIYSFHMPVFVFLSGYFTSQLTNDGKKRKWLKQTLLIYIVAQLASFVLAIGLEYIQAIVTNGSFNNSFSSLKTWKGLIYPQLALWYLICLIYWRFAVWQLFSKMNDNNLICISCILSLVSGVIPIDHAFSFQRAFAFFPFFVLGMIFRKHHLMSKLGEIPYFYALGGVLIGLVIVSFLPMFVPKFHYISWRDPIMRVTQSALGFYLCILLIRVLRIDFVERFAKYGVYTLWIYIGHTYLIIIGKKAFPFLGIQINLLTAFLLACIYCVIFICLAKFYHTKIDKRF